MKMRGGEGVSPAATWGWGIPGGRLGAGTPKMFVRLEWSTEWAGLCGMLSSNHLSQKRQMRSSCPGPAKTNPTRKMTLWVQSLASLSRFKYPALL